MQVTGNLLLSPLPLSISCLALFLIIKHNRSCSARWSSWWSELLTVWMDENEQDWTYASFGEVQGNLGNISFSGHPLHQAVCIISSSPRRSHLITHVSHVFPTILYKTLRHRYGYLLGDKRTRVANTVQNHVCTSLISFVPSFGNWNRKEKKKI